VVKVHNPRATRAYDPQPEVIRQMIDTGIKALTGHATAADGWRSLLSAKDTIGVKVHSLPGSASGTRPAVASAVIHGLLEAGIPADQIILWDRRMDDLRAAGFDALARRHGVRIAGAADAGFDPADPYDHTVLGQLVFGDLEFGRTVSGTGTNGVLGRRSHFSRLITQRITRFINIAPLLNHNEAGVCGILYTLASAATDNFYRFEKDRNPTLLAGAVPEIYGHGTNYAIADRVAVNIIDALIGQYEGGQTSRLNYSGIPNEIWFSTDPVALDVLAIEELNRIRAQRGVPVVTNRFELYENARLLELGTSDTREVDVLRLD
jgi:hypothetical protein